MAENSKIGWTDATWNPIVGCSLVSPGCTNCYAMTMAGRIERMAEGAGRWSHYNKDESDVPADEQAAHERIMKAER